jgi:hypothetical protein
MYKNNKYTVFYIKKQVNTGVLSTGSQTGKRERRN